MLICKELLNAVRLRFWTLGGRNLARKTVHTNVVCFKCKPIPSSQIMGNLPYERVSMAPPFSVTGLDLGGPYFVTYKNQRKGVLNKIYVCVCIYFVTCAIHLEILSDLTSDAIIATLKRFMSKRGKCSKFFTDNATNFVGANSQLKAFIRPLTFQIKIWRHISLRKIKLLAENNNGNSGSLEKMEYRLSEYSPTEEKEDDREGQCNVWYNGNCRGGFYTSLQLAFRARR
ncbi:integrase catalytic domain-containing protein [Trichonephila clavipes]|nr:integrase catalytic domain-containing protein [Trichonephila clavipes]